MAHSATLARNHGKAAAARIGHARNGHPPVNMFERLSHRVAHAMGRPAAFLTALLVVVVWAVSGPVFGFSDTWQLVINTGTTIVTFLMVFLIQQSQNRDTLALQVKLAELIIAAKGAKNHLATAEDLSERELTELHDAYCRLADHTLAHLEARQKKKK
jgi:low affinity Fe/Cu permease